MDQHNYTAILSQLKLLAVNAFRVQVENGLKNIFSNIVCLLQSRFDINSCGQDRTGGITVVQVKHRRDINLKLSVGVSLEDFKF